MTRISRIGGGGGGVSLSVANTWTATQTFNPSNGGTAIALLGEQTTSASAMVNIIYTSTDQAGTGPGTYPFIQATAGDDLYIGVLSGDKNVGTTAQQNTNVSIGTQSLQNNTTGWVNTALGYGALMSNTTGLNNTALGGGAHQVEGGPLLNNTTGSSNIAIGAGNPLGHNTTGNSNIAIGNASADLSFHAALYSNTTGSHNIAVGNTALYTFNDTTGASDYLVALGHNAGQAYTSTERNNILIGSLTVTGDIIQGVVGESNVIRLGGSASLHAYFGGPIASSTTTLQNSVSLNLLGAYWSGTASVPYGFRIYSVQDATTPTAHLSFNLNNNGTITQLVKLDQAGNFSDLGLAANQHVKFTTSTAGKVYSIGADLASGGQELYVQDTAGNAIGRFGGATGNSNDWPLLVLGNYSGSTNAIFGAYDAQVGVFGLAIGHGSTGATTNVEIQTANSLTLGLIVMHSQVQHKAGLALNITSATANYTITGGDELVILDNASTGANTVTLPAASSLIGRYLVVVKTDSSVNAVTVNRTGTDTIEGSATKTLANQYSKIILVSDGTSTWYDLTGSLV